MIISREALGNADASPFLFPAKERFLLAGFILVVFFGMMVYLLSRNLTVLNQIKDILDICLEFDDSSN